MIARALLPFVNVFGALLALALHAGDAAAEDPLKISYVPGNAIYWDIDTAIDKGFFRDEGFAPEIVVFQSSAQSIQLLISNQVLRPALSRRRATSPDDISPVSLARRHFVRHCPDIG